MLSTATPQSRALLSAIAAAALLGSSACLPTLPGAAPVSVVDPAPARTATNTIRIGKAVRGDLSGIVTFTAQLRAKGEMAIVPRVTARVDRILVDAGARVRAGDTLAELDRGDLEQQVLQAQAVQAAAEARLAELKAGPKAEVLAQAQAALQPDAQAVSAADAALTAARNRLSQIQNDPARANDRPALDTARNDVQRAEQALSAARTPTGTQAAVEQARRELQDAEEARL